MSAIEAFPPFEEKLAAGWLWRNWAETKTCRPRRLFKPRNEDEVIQIVKLAEADGVKLKVVGSGHSPNDIACTDGYMVSLARMNRIVHVVQETGLVTVEAGVTLEQLNEVLPRDHGLALSILGSISEQSLAGALATATHGSGLRYGCMPTTVTAFRIVLADGSVLTASKEENSDVFSAGLCSLGALGIITQVTMKCPPAFNLQSETTFVRFEEMRQSYRAHIESADHVAFYWYPHTDTVMLVKHTRCNLPIANPAPGPWMSAFINATLETTLFLARYVPVLNYVFNNIWASIASFFSVKRVDQSHKIFNFDCHFRQYVAEWAIPIDRFPQAIGELKEWIDANQYVHFPVEVRFVQGDDIWASPNTEYDTCHIGLVMYKPFGLPVKYRAFFEATQRIMAAVNGRPHWAKSFSLPLTYLHRVYPKLSSFISLAHKLDPHQRFWSAWHQRVLAPLDTC
eukprot:m.235587 g.235587  ORF g.235587 m.235587 type:complete len:455 (+) comp20145_c0_seq1:56-1420(+)